MASQEDVFGRRESRECEVGDESKRHDDRRLWAERLLGEGHDGLIRRDHTVKMETDLDHGAERSQGADHDSGAADQDDEAEDRLQRS